MRDWVVAQKRRLHAKIPLSDVNLHAIPHISLYKMRMEDNDDMIKKKVSAAIKKHTSFHQPLSGIEYLLHGDVSFSVCVKVSKPERIIALYHSLREVFKFKKVSFYPHLTIARDIAYDTRPIVESIFQIVEYEDTFCCNDVLVLKRDCIVPNSRYHEIFKIPLQF